MKISQEDAILIIIVRRLLSELSDKGRKLGSIDSLLKRICKTGTIVSGNQAVVDRVGLVAVNELLLSQEDKPKKH